MKDLKAQARAARMNVAEVIDLATRTVIALQRYGSVCSQAANGYYGLAMDVDMYRSPNIQAPAAEVSELARLHHKALCRMLKVQRDAGWNRG